MSKDSTIEGFPGGNWPSTTGEKSGGNRGNAPGLDDDWGWDDNDDEGEDSLKALERKRQETKEDLQRMPSPADNASTPWSMTGEVEFFLFRPDYRRIKLKDDDTLYHLHEGVTQAYSQRDQAHYFQNIRPGDVLNMSAYRPKKYPTNTVIFSFEVQNWKHEAGEEQPRTALKSFSLNKQAYEAWQTREKPK